ncbi:predicted protein [Histoplasma capsulatum G186AR]|uniref:Uncharacterized protein n=1 Tax=Ajellomyces capsulatus (strain G186AR / H82 / ATCC MYA-2454 / RMSCC 2432) TaxID=447093 RepID=C0NG10_AJECG|nr:uncharacterized protein HCBG_01826 [Histoplasma capsulatum G186AR]EEH10181.1 predicted protein [Histoplasma capsulatum G186AR]
MAQVHQRTVFHRNTSNVELQQEGDRILGIKTPILSIGQMSDHKKSLRSHSDTIHEQECNQESSSKARDKEIKPKYATAEEDVMKTSSSSRDTGKTLPTGDDCGASGLG